MLQVFDYRQLDASSPEDDRKLCPNRLLQALDGMSDGDLNALEDDLDFCQFTGVPSVRMLSILKELTRLDTDWATFLDRKARPAVPAMN